MGLNMLPRAGDRHNTYRILRAQRLLQGAGRVPGAPAGRVIAALPGVQQIAIIAARQLRQPLWALSGRQAVKDRHAGGDIGSQIAQHHAASAAHTLIKQQRQG